MRPVTPCMMSPSRRSAMSPPSPRSVTVWLLGYTRRSVRVKPSRVRGTTIACRSPFTPHCAAVILARHDAGGVTVPFAGERIWTSGRADKPVAAQARAQCGKDQGGDSRRRRATSSASTASTARGSMPSPRAPGPTSGCSTTTSATRKRSTGRCCSTPIRKSAGASAS